MAAPTESDLLQAWEDANHDPRLYRALLVDRDFHIATRPVLPPEELGYPVEYEPAGVEKPRDPGKSPWH